MASSRSQSFCDFGDSTDSGADILREMPLSFADRNSLAGPTPPRLDVDWSGSPPLSLSLRFSGLFNESDLEGDLTRQTHRSEVSLDMSYDIQTFPNIKDTTSDFNDSDISEVVLMTPKLPSTLSTIPEAVEPSPVLAYTTTLSDFDILLTNVVPNSDTKVMVCKRHKTGKMYKIRSRRIYDHVPWTEQDILETLRDLGAPFLPYLRSSFREDNHIHLVLDYLPSGNLHDLIMKYGTLGSQRVLFYASEILVGLSNLHSVGIMHRNLNPNDIMFDPQGHVVITNFEFADFVASSRMNSHNCFSNVWLSARKPQCYQAPEILLGWAHDPSVDCWGFGMVLYFMYFGKHPFKDGKYSDSQDSLRTRVIDGALSPESLRLIHPQTRDLILKCVERNPRVRLTLEGIKGHSYFANIPWSKVSDRVIEVPPLPGYFDSMAGHNLLRNSISSDLRQSATAATTKAREEARCRHVGRRAPSVVDEEQPNPAVQVAKVPMATPVSATGESSATAPPTEPRRSSTEGDASTRPTKSKTFRPFRDSQTHIPSSSEEAMNPSNSGLEIWDILDQEEAGEQASLRSAEFGKSVVSFFRSRRLQHKQGSSIYPRQFFLNLSTSTASFNQRLRRKPKSTSALRGLNAEPLDVVPPADLPVGLEQIGSGIGFQYNMAPANRSRASICTSTPRSCSSMFGAAGHFSLGLKSGLKKANNDLNLPVVNNLDQDHGFATGEVFSEGGITTATVATAAAMTTFRASQDDSSHSTFLREMCHTPSWILSPKGSLPTLTPPTVLGYDSDSGTTKALEPTVSASSTPRSEEEDDGPYTPTTVVGEDVEEVSDSSDPGGRKGNTFEVGAVNIFEEPTEADLTLRLVTPRGLRLSLSSAM